MENRVHRFCREPKLVSATLRCRRSKGQPGPAVHDDLVRREFRAAGPVRVRLTNITEHLTAEGKVNICAVRDVWSREIVSWATSRPDDGTPR
jgi:transposase InsO family protein